jgi:hypothetical protein
METETYPFTKEAVSVVLGILASKQIEKVIVNQTDLDEDSGTVRIASALGGMTIAYKLRKRSDAAVDYTASVVKKIKETWKANSKDNDTQSETP